MNNGINPDELTQILTMVLIGLIAVVMVLAIVYVIIKLKNNKRTQKDDDIISSNKTTSDAKKIAKEYTKQSIYKFMEFDKVEDNMIVQKNGTRYLMAIECQGVNYDLMSTAEKISIEEGFLQFLNTLRHPIQIYVQTRTVNLNSSIETYKKKVDEIKYELDKKRDAYLKKLQSGQYPKEELEKEFYEVTKQTNLYEYGKDIITNTERMSLNKNVLNKKYYIIIPYYPEDLGNNAFDKEEIKNIAFSELYTKAQAIIRTLSGCEVGGKIMTSNQLVDLLYVAYNRDESETYGIEKALRAGYDELYSTAPDVLDKKMEQLNSKIEKQALELANEKVIQARSIKEQKIDNIEMSFEELVRQRAEMILKQNERYIGKNTAKKATELLSEDTKEGGKEDVEQKEKKTTRRRATSKSNK